MQCLLIPPLATYHSILSSFFVLTVSLTLIDDLYVFSLLFFLDGQQNDGKREQFRDVFDFAERFDKKCQRDIFSRGSQMLCKYRVQVVHLYVRTYVKNLYTSSKTMRKYEYADRRRHLPRIKLEKKNKRNFKFERFLQSFFSSFPVRGEGIRDEEGVRQVARALHWALQDPHRLHGADQVHDRRRASRATSGSRIPKKQSSCDTIAQPNEQVKLGRFSALFIEAIFASCSLIFFRSSGPVSFGYSELENNNSQQASILTPGSEYAASAAGQDKANTTLKNELLVRKTHPLFVYFQSQFLADLYSMSSLNVAPF